MKTLTQTLFFFLLVTQMSFAQWYQQNSNTMNDLQAVDFTDANNGIAVGWIGTILKTSDSGINWINQYNGTEWLSAVSFVDVNNGLAVGYDQVNYKSAILRTTDGGNNWAQMSIGTGNYLHSVSFIDTNMAIAVGDDGLIIKTTNSGNTWSTQSSGTTFHLHGVSFFDSNLGTVVGGTFNISGGRTEGIILRTTNGGSNWVIVYSDSTSELLDVHLIDPNNQIVVGGGDFRGQGVILRTTDGGNNWLKSYNSEGYGYEAVSFTDANTGTIVGGKYGEESIILRTSNSGGNWVTQSSGITNYLRGVSFSDALTGWAVGDMGTILHTTNGGVPVELTSFTASANGKEVVLNWSTATEVNNQGFEIQRNREEEEFFTVGFVNGHGTTTELQNYSYTDRNLDNGQYYYRLKQVDFDGSYEYSDVVEVDFRAFNSYLLEQNYPNPFNPTTTIGFGLQSKSNVKITILNAIGEEVAVVLNEEREPGFHQVEFSAANLPSGVYFYQLKATPNGGQAGEFISTKKMLLLK